jgi:hypothetical protein
MARALLYVALIHPARFIEVKTEQTQVVHSLHRLRLQRIKIDIISLYNFPIQCVGCKEQQLKHVTRLFSPGNGLWKERSYWCST